MGNARPGAIFDPPDVDSVVALLRHAAGPRPNAGARTRVDRLAGPCIRDPRNDRLAGDAGDADFDELVLRRAEQIAVTLTGREHTCALQLADAEEEALRRSLVRSSRSAATLVAA